MIVLDPLVRQEVPRQIQTMPTPDLQVHIYLPNLRFLSHVFDLTEPMPNLERSDSLNVRRRILSLTQEDAGSLGVGKGTLHHLRKHANDGGSFRLYSKIRQKIDLTTV